MQTVSESDYRDIQGLLRCGFGKIPAACYLHLRIGEPAAAGKWLASLPVTNAAECKPPPEHALQVAFTAAGLCAVRVPVTIRDQFSAEFCSGMAGEPDRSRRLGDFAENAPKHWEWGDAAETMPHVMLMLFAKTGLESWCEELKRAACTNGFTFLRCLDTSDLDEHEPFGFRDGISQPDLDWERQRRVSEWDEAEYTNRISLGEFVLGYPNEYGLYTSRPLVADPAADLPDAEEPEHRGWKDLGKNGTYLVFRRLAQDVRGFWRFLDEQAQGDAARRVRLAELMVGRRMDEDGTPLVGGDPEAFTYESDLHGRACPFGAHIRRANPRTADLPYGTDSFWLRIIRFFGFGRTGIHGDLIASSRFHRILRRGREYGKNLEPEAALLAPTADEGERGINFICLNANIARQFEFVQNAWMMSAKFDALAEESDPLLGNRRTPSDCPGAAAFTYREGDGVPTRVRGLPQFVTVRAGAYFFLPGIRALRYLAQAGAHQEKEPSDG